LNLRENWLPVPYNRMYSGQRVRHAWRGNQRRRTGHRCDEGVGQCIVLMFGFEKKDQTNIKADELRTFRKAAHVYLGYSEEEMTAIVREKSLSEIAKPNFGRGERHGKSV